MATHGEIQKAIEVLEELKESGNLRIATDPTIIRPLKVIDIYHSDTHGAPGILITIDLFNVINHLLNTNDK